MRNLTQVSRIPSVYTKKVAARGAAVRSLGRRVPRIHLYLSEDVPLAHGAWGTKRTRVRCNAGHRGNTHMEL